MMHHKAVEVEFKENTVLEVKFQTGEVKSYDMALLFEKHVSLQALQNRNLFLAGRLCGSSGIYWNDDLDIDVETIYEDGTTIRIDSDVLPFGDALCKARARAELSQKELSVLTGIDQSDISKIERGIANPSVGTLNRIAKAMGCSLVVDFIFEESQDGHKSSVL